jgi:hypothetical protein
LSELSPGLKSLLAFEPSNLRAVSEIARNPVMLAEVTAALPAIKARATGAATPGEIEAIIGAKFATYRQPERSAAEWAAFWSDYHTVLADVPKSALEAAMDAVIRDPKVEFLPKPAKLAEIARMTENRAVRAYDRARQAVEFSEPVARESVGPAAMAELLAPIGRKPVDKTPAEKEAIKSAMRKFIEADDARREREKAARRVSGPEVQMAPVENGITPQMRSLLGLDHDNVTQPPS